jgi:acetylornithine deacetylase/succinyl-diaminopimelate desuccinylase-like protein
MDIQTWIQQEQTNILTGLETFLRYPTISAQTSYQSSLHACAHWLKDYLHELGFQTALYGEPPVVYAYYEGPPGAPTLLFYGHYDVQPPDPLELWETPPFEPTIRDGAIYARGACDDKGQVWAHLTAWRYWAAHGGLPVSLHVLIEGQEETGSETLYKVLDQHGHLWKADAGIVSDTAFFSEEFPTLTTGLRGLLYTEIRVEGPARDLHSGTLGGVVQNPAWALASILAQLKGPDGRILIPGFYDEVLPPDPLLRRQWQTLPANESYYLSITGAPTLWGEVGFSPLERATIRPTLDVHGLYSGYIGEGSKTIIPAYAIAKVSMRLVPRQNPEKIWEAFQRYIHELTPPGVRISVSRLHEPAPAFETPTDSPFYQAAAQAVHEAFGKAPIPLKEGGSIPVLSALQKFISGPIVLMGFGLPTDQIHSPNEHFRLHQLWRGIHAAIAFYQKAGTLRVATPET